MKNPQLANPAGSEHLTADSSSKPQSKLEVPEQRGAPRVGLLIRAAKLIADGREFLCIVRDASATGAKARIFHPLPQHKILVLDLGNRNFQPVEVVWSTDGHVGLRFIEAADVRSLIEEGHSPFSKRQLRFRTAVEATLHLTDNAYDVIICNISQQGACIECDRRLLIDQLLRLEAHALFSSYAKVRWRRGRRYGLVFEETFRLDELAQLLAQVQSVQASCQTLGKLSKASRSIQNR